MPCSSMYLEKREKMSHMKTICTHMCIKVRTLFALHTPGHKAQGANRCQLEAMVVVLSPPLNVCNCCSSLSLVQLTRTPSTFHKDQPLPP